MTTTKAEVAPGPSLKNQRPLDRIAYFAGTMRPGQDGVTRVLYKLIEHLDKRELDNIFISPVLGDEHPTTMYQVPSFAFPLYKDYRLAYPGQRHFDEALNKFKPDLIHIHSPCSLGYAAVRYAHKMDIPVAATYHTHFASYAKYYNVRALETLGWNYLRTLYNSCDCVYVPSQPILEELIGHGFQNLTFLPHGVDTNVFSPRFRSSAWRTQLGLDGKLVLLFSGRLVWEKDLRTLAKIYQILSARRNDLGFVLVGDGPIRAELSMMMPGAHFLGYLTGHELSMAYASSDLFVFPSTTETFGNVTIEAMSSGIPVIGAQEGGSGGLVQNGITGLLAKPHDGHDFARKIEYLADSVTMRKRIASRALLFARSQSWEAIFDRLLSSYEAVVESHAKRRMHRAKAAA